MDASEPELIAKDNVLKGSKTSLIFVSGKFLNEQDKKLPLVDGFFKLDWLSDT